MVSKFNVFSIDGENTDLQPMIPGDLLNMEWGRKNVMLWPSFCLYDIIPIHLIEGIYDQR